MNLNQAMTHFIPKIEAEMQRVMTPPDKFDGLYGMLHYHLGWRDENLKEVDASQGKRLRPLFTVLCCQAAGGDPARALPAAAAVELVHNFSLIHDDIEDRSDTRRGRRTVWHIWGEPQAINAGDAMFVLARNALLQLQAHDVPLPIIIEAIDRLDQTCFHLCRGQFWDMGFEETMSVSLEAYLQMIEGKTSALLACAGYLGALIATHHPGQAERYWDLGLALGLAFQIQDDWLGIWGDEALTGKPTADDLRRRKKSLPVVYALNHASPSAQLFRDMYAKSESTEAEIVDAIDMLDELGARQHTETMAQRYIDQAEKALSNIETSDDNVALHEMAQFLIKRMH